MNPRAYLTIALAALLLLACSIVNTVLDRVSGAADTVGDIESIVSDIEEAVEGAEDAGGDDQQPSTDAEPAPKEWPRRLAH
jgi:hypothetical protein